MPQTKKPENQTTKEKSELFSADVQQLEVSDGEIKDFIDSSINNIEGKLFNSPATDKQSLTLFDMNKLDRKKHSDLAMNRNIMMERNLIEVPIAVYSKKAKKNWVEYKNKDTETKVGTPDGALTGFDERIFWGVVGHRSKLYIKNDKVYYVSYFTTYDVIKDLSLASGGRVRKIINNSINKLGNMIINYKNFKVSHGKDNGAKTVEFIDRSPMFKYSGTRTVRDDTHEKNYHLFIWNDPFSYNMVNEYVKYISKQRYIEITDDLTRRIWIYLSCKLGVQKSYSENLKSLLDSAGITRKNLTRAVQTLTDKLDYLVEKKDFEKYTIKDRILTIYPTHKFPDLRDRILDWLYRDCFNNWVQTPRPVMATKLNTLIKNYGDRKIEDIFLNTAEYRGNPHPRHFLDEIKRLESEIEPITEQLTTGERRKLIDKLKK